MKKQALNKKQETKTIELNLFESNKIRKEIEL